MRPVRIVAAVMLTAALAVTGCAAHSTADRPSAAPTSPVVEPAPAPPLDVPAPAPRAPNPGPGPSAPPPTLPLGRIERLNAIQVVGSRTVWAVGKGAILMTSDGGHTWIRVWRGAQELRQVDFVSASTGWALGDRILLGTVDGGRHWRQLGQPAAGPLRQVHFSGPTQG